MPGKNKESKSETPIKLTRRPIKSPDKDENPAPDAEEEESMLVDDVDENEGVSREQDEPVVQKVESKTKERKDQKDEAPSRLYPEIPGLDDHEDKDEATRRSWICHVICVLFVAAVCFLANRFLYPPEVKGGPVLLFDVDAVVSTLRQEFDSLHEKNFRVLKAALRNMTRDVEPRAPAVLLVVSPEDNGSDGFASRLAGLLNRTYVPLSGTELGRMEDSKKHLHSIIRERVEKENATVFLVSQLQRLTFDATMVFHSFCDDQNAPYKRVAYVMTMTCGAFDPATKWDQIGMDCLTRSWPDVHADMMNPLITRLTPSLMILRKKIADL